MDALWQMHHQQMAAMQQQMVQLAQMKAAGYSPAQW
jgi:hypothetical protein